MADEKRDTSEGTCWFEAPNGPFYVEVGSEPWRRLLEKGAEPADGTTDEYALSDGELREALYELSSDRLDELAGDPEASRADLLHALLNAQTPRPRRGGRARAAKGTAE